jgi:hypothetical protein
VLSQTEKGKRFLRDFGAGINGAVLFPLCRLGALFCNHAILFFRAANVG